MGKWEEFFPTDQIDAAGSQLCLTPTSLSTKFVLFCFYSKNLLLLQHVVTRKLDRRAKNKNETTAFHSAKLATVLLLHILLDIFLHVHSVQLSSLSNPQNMFCVMIVIINIYAPLFSWY
jgi:hypothetical protein